MGVVEQVGRAIAAAIDGAEFGWAPELDFAKLKGKRILVVPAGGTREVSARNFTLRTVETSVCVAARATEDDAPELVEDLERMAGLLQRTTLADSDGNRIGAVTKAAYDPIYDAGMLRASHVFFAIVSLTVVVTRAEEA